MASRGLGSLTLDLIAKIGGFTGPLSKAERELQGSTRRMNKMANDFGRALGVGIAAAAGLAATGIGLYIKNTIEAEKVQAQLAARIKDTGGAAQRSIEQLNAQAEKLQGLTVFDDEAIGSAQAMLLTFKQIQGVNFDRATEAVLDLSTAMGTDLNSAALQLGKALNDPVKGLGALSRAGIQFSADQKELIKSLVEAGNVAGAQRVILKELEGQMGSAAEAARDTLGGSLKALQNSFDNLLEGDSSGAGMLATREAVEALNTTLNDPEIKSAIDTIAGGIAGLVAEFVGALPAIANFGTQLYSTMSRVSEALVAVRDVQVAMGRFDFEGAEKAAERGRNIMAGTDFRNVRGGSDVESGILTLDTMVVYGTSPKPASKDKGKGGAKKTGKSDAEREAEQLKAAYDRLNASLAEQVALFGETSEAAKLRYELENGELSKLTQGQKDGLIVQAESLDAMREEKELQEDGKRLIESLLDPFEQVNAERAEALKLLQAGVIAQEDYNKAIESSRTPAEQLLEDLQFEISLLGKTREEQELLTEARLLGAEAATVQGQVALQALKDYQAAEKQNAEAVDIADGARDSFRGLLGDLREGKNLWDSLTDAALNFLDVLFEISAKNATEQLFGAYGSTGSGSTGGGWLSAFADFFSSADSGFGFASGGFTGYGGKNQPAGIVHKGEYVMPMDAVARIGIGNLDRLSRGGSAGGPVTIPQTFVFQGRMDSRTADQVAQQAATEGRIAAVRNGG